MKTNKKLVSMILFVSLIVPMVAVQLVEANASQYPNSSQTGLKIVASTAIPADIVKNILGDKGTVEAILTTPDEETIHHFEGPTEAQKVTIKEANLFVAFGI